MIATQNPIEYEGTYPLPEAQLDRFLFKLLVGYPTAEQEEEMLARHDAGLDPHDLAAAGVRPWPAPPTSPRAGRAIARIRVDPAVLAVHRGDVPGDPRVAVAAARRVASRRDDAAARRQGVGVAVAVASFVTPDEVKAVAKPVPASPHQRAPRPGARGHPADAVLDGILATVPTPR